MDPYIINNMPDDEVLEADLEMVADDIKLSVVHDGGTYVLTVGTTDSDAGAVVAAFDPTISLEVVLSFIAVIRQAHVTGGSAQANAIAADLKARNDARQAAQDVADLD
jgi:hypothetical protein